MTRIERWIANPYEIFARNVLKLEKMKELGVEPDAGAARDRSFTGYCMSLPAHSPPICRTTSRAKLTRIANEHFAALDGAPLVEAFWRPNFQRFARWFAATEPARRRGVASILTEADGLLDLTAGGGFRLTARADRIDVKRRRRGGDLRLQDRDAAASRNMSRSCPRRSCPLEAAIAEAGGFEGLNTCEVSGLVYIHVSGRNDGGEERAAATKTVSAHARRAKRAAETERPGRTLCRPEHALRGEAPVGAGVPPSLSTTTTTSTSPASRNG